MGIGATWATDLNKLVMNATTHAALASAAGTATNLFVSLHTADPGTTGANETVYGGYGRATVARTSGGWTCSGFTVVPAANIDFAQCSSLTATITHFGVGTLVSGGEFLFGGTVSPNISVSTGVTPRLTTATTLTLS
jgi:hypothetical protein